MATTTRKSRPAGSRGKGAMARARERAEQEEKKGQGSGFQPRTAPRAASLTRSQRLSLRWGRGTRQAMAVALSGLVTAAVALLSYLAVMAVATQVVPMAMIFVASYLPVPLEQLSTEQVVIYWLAPGLFLVLVMLAVVLAALRFAWGWRTRRVRAINAFFVPEAADEVTAGGAAVLRSGKDSKSLKDEEKDNS